MNLTIIIKIKYLSKHLDECIKSILSQNLVNYEIILISEKNNTSLDVFLLNLLSKYRKHINIQIIQKETNDLNLILNEAIKLAKGRYISIINQDVLFLKNTYFEVLKKIEEFNYDILVLDYIKILEDISFLEVYKRYNSCIKKEEKKNSFIEKKYIKILKENELIFDFSKYLNKETNNLKIKTRGLKYYSSNIYESIQEIELGYKYKILKEVDIQDFNYIIKADLLKNNLYIFPSQINTKLDILKILPQIKSISSIKDTLVCKYEIDEKKINLNKNKGKIIKNNINLDFNLNTNELIDITKNRYRNIIEMYKMYNSMDMNIYIEVVSLMEYYIFTEILDLNNKLIKVKEDEYKKYLNEIIIFLKKEFSNYLNNKYLSKNLIYKINLKRKIYKTNKYINKVIKVEKLNEKKELKLQGKKITNKNVNKIRIKEKNKKKKEKGKREKKDKATETKLKINIFRVFIRKIKIDINKIKRTRINKEFKNIISKLNIIKIKIKIKTKNIFKKIYIMIFNKKSNKNSKNLKLTEKKILLLYEGKNNSNIDKKLNSKINKVENKNKIKK